MPFETLLTTAETAEKLRIRRQTLEAWRMTGQGPKFIKMGRRVFYRLSDVETWITNRTVASTSELRATP